MIFGSLFSGIGGIDLGLERAGMTCAWQVEKDKFCTKVLTKHWPDIPKYGDIRNVGKENLRTVDLIAGGFPCQPFSNAGKRRGTEDDRHLWPEMLRVIQELKPTWVLGENVPGIIPLFIDQAIDDLEAEGYTCETFVLPAAAFDAPHKRDRVFVISHTKKTRLEICKGISGNAEKEFSPVERGHSKFLSDANSNQPGETNRANGRMDGKQQQETGAEYSWCELSVEPTIHRVDDGVPGRLDRLRKLRIKALGNAVVPQVAEHIGHIIMKADEQRSIE